MDISTLADHRSGDGLGRGALVLWAGHRVDDASGVESYVAEFRAKRLTYFLPGGDTLTLAVAIARHRNCAVIRRRGVSAAIRGAQPGAVMYPEFKHLTMKAGCTGYAVWIAGGHVAWVDAHAQFTPIGGGNVQANRSTEPWRRRSHPAGIGPRPIQSSVLSNGEICREANGCQPAPLLGRRAIRSAAHADRMHMGVSTALVDGVLG